MVNMIFVEMFLMAIMSMWYHRQNAYDPHGLCQDVSNVGRWDNGDVEVGFENLEDLPQSH